MKTSISSIFGMDSRSWGTEFEQKAAIQSSFHSGGHRLAGQPLSFHAANKYFDNSEKLRRRHAGMLINQ
jgi:hypothetical protein